ncbi:MAG: VWA domain-containing protein, partial [Gallionella sp.]
MKSIFNPLARKLRPYLGLATSEALVALRKEHKRTQLIDVQRRIRIYLQALWGCDFVIKAIDGDSENSERRKPYVRNDLIHLPNAYYDFTLHGIPHFTGLETYRAASAHAAAHIIYSKNHFSEKSFDKWQRALISTIEDAR